MERLDINVVTGETTLVTIPDAEVAEMLATAAQIIPIEAMQNLREHRNSLLQSSDAAVLPDRWATMSAETQTAWATYRQALRDLPATTADALNPVWPVAPEV